MKPLYTSGKDYKKQLKRHVKKLSSLQRLHCASDHWSPMYHSQIVLDTPTDLKMAYPETTAERHDELESFRRQL